MLLRLLERHSNLSVRALKTTLLLPLACALGASATAVAAPVQSALPGNVVVIVLDDVGVDMIGAYDAYYQTQGQPPGTPADTPAIDSLMAARGMMFVNAWTCPSCSPSRAQILTGRHAFRTGIGSTIKDTEPVPADNPGLDYGQVLLPQVLHNAPSRYTCVAVGKWHLADMDQVQADLRHPLGLPIGNWFDRFAGSLFNLNHPSTGATPGLQVYSDWEKTYASELITGVNPCPFGSPPCQVGTTVPPVANYVTVNQADDAIAVMNALPEPYFLYVAFDAIHEPTNHVIPSGLPTVSCGAYTPPLSPCSSGQNLPVTTTARCEMEALDGQLARLLCAIDESDTTVILLGDNGTTAEAVLPPYDPNHSKGTVYNGGVQVPFIVRSPLLLPQLAGHPSKMLVSSTDIFATVAEIAGIAPTTVSAEDSVSIVPYLRGVRRMQRKSMYTESFLPNFTPDPVTGGVPAGYVATRQAQAVRNARFKLIRRWTRDHLNANLITLQEEFYDLLQGGPLNMAHVPPTPTPDPFETHDLLANGNVPTGTEGRNLTHLRATLDAIYPTLVH
jgi:arylsulfatase A-like enzyme